MGFETPNEKTETLKVFVEYFKIGFETPNGKVFTYLVRFSTFTSVYFVTFGVLDDRNEEKGNELKLRDLFFGGLKVNIYQFRELLIRRIDYQE